MESWKNRIQKHIPGVYIKSLMIGSSPGEDRDNGYLGGMPPIEQVDFACESIRNDPNLADGYNGIGISQGGLFLRAVAQKCPGMKTLVSVGSPQQGIGSNVHL